MEDSPANVFVFLASDHAGFALKNFLVDRLRVRGYTVEDMGAHTFSAEDDYPDFVTPCAQRVAKETPREADAPRGETSVHEADAPRAFGIVIGGSGQGEAMAANRVRGVRAAVFYGGAEALGKIDAAGTPASDTLDIVRLTREHNNANILSLGARFLSEEDALRAVLLFLTTPFSAATRHARRIGKY